MGLSKDIVESAKEIFSTMVMMEIEENKSHLKETTPLKDTISGVIGMAGTHKGVLAIHLPHQVAKVITSSFLGMDIEEINEDVEDAIGELANMLGGSVKSSLSDKGKDIDLSLPTTISGHQYDFQPTKEVERIIIPFTCNVGQFIIEMQLEK